MNRLAKSIVDIAISDAPEEQPAKHFVTDLARPLTNYIQITSDGNRACLDAVEDAFGADVDYAMLVKVYGTPTVEDQRKYSPAACTSCTQHVVTGNPDKAEISTRYVERQNLTIRMGSRRFTRLANAFSRKPENHIHALALHFMYYNFTRRHMSLRVSPAMKAGIADHLWSIEEIVDLLPELKCNTRPKKAKD